jgi:hypothetical protein
MAVLQGAVSGNSAEVTPEGALQVTQVGTGDQYAISATTGIMAAALGANSTVFAARMDPGGGKKAIIKRIRLRWVCLVAFTVPLTAGRRLSVYVGSGSAAGGGTDITAAGKKSTTYPESEIVTASGGGMRIATTGALTITGITYLAPEFDTMALVAYGNAGNFAECIFDYDAAGGLELLPGELVAIRNPQAMDAAGTWQLTVDMDWDEVPV